MNRLSRRMRASGSNPMPSDMASWPGFYEPMSKGRIDAAMQMPAARIIGCVRALRIICNSKAMPETMEDAENEDVRELLYWAGSCATMRVMHAWRVLHVLQRSLARQQSSAGKGQLSAQFNAEKMPCVARQWQFAPGRPFHAKRSPYVLACHAGRVCAQRMKIVSEEIYAPRVSAQLPTSVGSWRAQGPPDVGTTSSPTCSMPTCPLPTCSMPTCSMPTCSMPSNISN